MIDAAVDASIDGRAADYADKILRRLRVALAGKLRAVYLIGSLALGDYVSGRSDIDVAAVADGPLPIEEKEAIVGTLSHPGLECPTRGLEFVLYETTQVADEERPPRFEINLNTGPEMEQRVSFDPSTEPAHWFILDIAIARQRAIPITGPPASRLFAPIPNGRALDAILESLDWHSEYETLTHFSVLNACRSWRFADEGVWDSKAGAGAWARTRVDDPALIDIALALRHGGEGSPPDGEEVRLFIKGVQAHIADLHDEERRSKVS